MSTYRHYMPTPLCHILGVPCQSHVMFHTNHMWCSIPVTCDVPCQSHVMFHANHMWYSMPITSGVAKSIVRVVRVVHLLLRTRNFFQLTCPWTSEKSYIYVFISKWWQPKLKVYNLLLFYFRNSDRSKSFTKC